MPYRSKKRDAQRPVTPESGIVADLIRQFADRYAFYRELVQNSIDAGATRIEATLVHGRDGSIRSSVTDDGSGMTRHVIENNLLTLFSSTKEGDDSKVGKYGIGFVSVLAIAPDEVVVETWRDGRAHRLRLFADTSYELEELEARTGSGTTVALLTTGMGDAWQEHARASRAALLRWCRHASVPIHLTVSEPSAPDAERRERIDRALDLPHTVVVAEDGPVARIVVGAGPARPEIALGTVHEGAASFAGFYNRGLTLYETHEERFEGIEGVAFKLESRLLSHTLSRDDVRRDGEFSALLGRVAQIARGRLRAQVLGELSKEAERVGEGAGDQRYRALFAAALASRPEPDRGELWFPLTDAIDGEHAMSAKELDGRAPWRKPLLVSAGADALTRALARVGRPVVRVTHQEIVERLQALFESDSWLSPRVTAPAQDHAMWVEPLSKAELGSADSELCEALARCLAGTRAAVGGVVLARVVGRRVGIAIAVDGVTAQLISDEQRVKATRTFGRKRVLALDVESEPVRRARERASVQVHATAHLLARLVLLQRDVAIDRRDDAALLAAYAETIR